MKENLSLIIWAAVILTAFIILWRKGLLARMRAYVLETREELRKCTWPSWDELKGSTIVVMITVLMLGTFTVAIDVIIAMFVKLIV